MGSRRACGRGAASRTPCRLCTTATDRFGASLGRAAALSNRACTQVCIAQPPSMQAAGWPHPPRLAALDAVLRPVGEQAGGGRVARARQPLARGVLRAAHELQQVTPILLGVLQFRGRSKGGRKRVRAHESRAARKWLGTRERASRRAQERVSCIIQRPSSESDSPTLHLKPTSPAAPAGGWS